MVIVQVPSDVLKVIPSSEQFSNLLLSYKREFGALVFSDYEKLLAVFDTLNISVSEYLELSRFLLEYVWEKLHTGHWKNVPIYWRLLYAAVRMLRAIYGTLKMYDHQIDFQPSECLQNILEDLDYSLIMGFPIFDTLAAELASMLHGTLSSFVSGPSIPNDPRFTQICTPNVSLDSFNKGNRTLEALERIRRPSLEKFQELLRIGRPFILTDAMTYWPACQPGGEHAWTVDYWSRTIGHRIVPVEIGSRYTDESWGQELMTMNRFIEQFIINPEGGSGDASRSVGYMAQHQLFLQIPELGRDVLTPDYCMVGGEADRHESTVDSNVWFGPPNTVSPLHHDSDRSNFLTQINGTKYVVLYTASETPFVYPHPESMLCNTSEADVEHPDFKKFPNLTLAHGFHGLLCPGEMLFIPPRCWHYIRSVSISFSVNFWWKVDESFIPPWPSD